jgi:hypothetical protein
VKHNPEESLHRHTVEPLQKLGPWQDDDDHTGWIDDVSCNLVGTLLEPREVPRFRELQTMLVEWRDAFFAAGFSP